MSIIRSWNVQPGGTHVPSSSPALWPRRLRTAMSGHRRHPTCRDRSAKCLRREPSSVPLASHHHRPGHLGSRSRPLKARRRCRFAAHPGIAVQCLLCVRAVGVFAYPTRTVVVLQRVMFDRLGDEEVTWVVECSATADAFWSTSSNNTHPPTSCTEVAHHLVLNLDVFPLAHGGVRKRAQWRRRCQTQTDDSCCEMKGLLKSKTRQSFSWPRAILFEVAAVQVIHRYRTVAHCRFRAPPIAIRKRTFLAPTLHA